MGLTVHERPDLDAPALLVMLSGWIDASGAAAAAMTRIEHETAARTIATFDADVFIDYRARRPLMQLRDGVSERLVWPAIEMRAGRDAAGRDVLVLTGYEPDAQWHRFAALVTDLAVEFGVRISVGLGAYPIGTPHTRPTRLSCTTPSAALAQSVPYLRNSVDVPAGASAALDHALDARGIPAIGLWAQVPHYVAAMAYPAASAALVEAVAATAGLSLDATPLRDDAMAMRVRLDELVAANPEHVAMVQQLEQAYDSAPSTLADDRLPSGEELAAELERFLRDQGG